MSNFPATVPRFTDEDDAKERASLTEDEIKKIQLDLFGELSSKTTVMRTQQRRQQQQQQQRNPSTVTVGIDVVDDVEDYIVEKIPPEEKADYLEALERCPRVVENESPVLAFLKCEDFNAKAAAERLVRYWRERRFLFGEEKAFLPIRLHQAMRDDLDMLERGTILLLPDDARGRTVVYYDRNRVDYSNPNRFSLLRVLWYIGHAGLAQESCENGVVIITNFRVESTNMFNRKLTKLIWFTVNQCLPIKVCSVHACRVPLFGIFLIPAIKSCIGRHVRLRFIVHKGGTNEDIVRKLERYGLRRSGIPDTLGGTYTSDIDEWLEERFMLGL